MAPRKDEVLLKAFFLLCFFSRVIAADIVGIVLTPNHYRYKDIESSCSHNYWISAVHLRMVVDSDRVSEAMLVSQLGTSALFSDTFIALSRSEAGKIHLHKDRFGKIWLKDFALSSRLTRWVMYETRSLYCSPPYYSNQMLHTATPEWLTFQFDIAAIENGKPSFSQTLEFQGLRRDGYAYEGALQLKQSPVY